jgi:hypothetical protein
MKLYKYLFAALIFALGFGGMLSARSLADVFPGMSEKTRAEVLGDGWAESTENADSLLLNVADDIRTAVSQPILDLKLSYLLESARVIKFNGTPEDAQLAVYNALTRISSLAGRTYHSHREDKYVPLFEETAVLKSQHSDDVISEPEPVTSLPESMNMYVRLKDNRFGECYYHASAAVPETNAQGLLFKLDNYKTIRYVIPVVRKGKFVTNMYFELLTEGLLCYTVAGIKVPSFADSVLNVPSAIQKRLDVIEGWIEDGVEGK